jgi:hypothetical protein
LKALFHIELWPSFAGAKRDNNFVEKNFHNNRRLGDIYRILAQWTRFWQKIGSKAAIHKRKGVHGLGCLMLKAEIIY